MRDIIETRHLCKRYGDFTAVDDLNLSIREGEVFGLLGPNGAGKTTTTLMLLGLTERSAGEISIDGLDSARDALAVKRIVGYMPDNVGFYPDMSGRENLRFTGELNGLSGAALDARVDALLARVGMTEAADRKVKTYSRGMRQRLGIADVLMKDPKIIVMDEPTLGIDPEGMRELIGLIRELSVKDGKTILISSHQLYQIQQICDRVGIFVKGRLVACGTLKELAAQLMQEGHYELEVSAHPCDLMFTEKLRAIEGVRRVKRLNEESVKLEAVRDVRTEVLKKVLEGGYALERFVTSSSELDEIYRLYFAKADEEGAGCAPKENAAKGSGIERLRAALGSHKNKKEAAKGAEEKTQKKDEQEVRG